jgi:hypothetical protein
MSRSLFLLTMLLAACGAPPQNDSAPEPDSSPAPGARGAPPPPAGPASSSQIPAAFHGRFDRTREACGTPSEYRLTVTAREMRFHESTGTVQSVTANGPREATVAAAYQGEGESWKARHLLRLSEDGGALTITGNGTSTTRVRCNGSPLAPAARRWDSAASGEGDALFYVSPSGDRTLTLFCPAGSADLLVNVPSFRPVGSEERMSFGAGGTVVALVADTRGDRQRGGVSGRGPVPDELAAILTDRAGVSVNYGSQNSGPHAAIPAELAQAFLSGCGD